MQEFINNFLSQVGNFLPGFLGGILILIVGWIAAYVIAQLVKSLLKRTSIDEKLAGFISSGGDPANPRQQVNFNVGDTISTIVYYVLLIGVFGLFFKAIGLTQISGPLGDLVRSFINYLPNIVSAGLILFFALILARLLQFLIDKTLTAFDLDNRFTKLNQTGVDTGPNAEEAKMQSVNATESNTSLTKVLSNTVYWLTILLFLPAVLGALKVPGLLEPVQSLLNKVLGYVPNIISASVIIVIGYFVAKVVRNIVENFLSSFGVDNFFNKYHSAQPQGGQIKFSKIIAQVVGVLILIPVVISGLEALNVPSITVPATNMLNQITGALPNIFAAILILAVAYYIGRVIGDVVSTFLSNLGVDGLLANAGVTQNTTGGKTPSQIAGILTTVFVVLFLGTEALNRLGFNLSAQLTSNLVSTAVNIVFGVIIFAIGFYIANLVAKAIQSSGVIQSGLLSTISRVLIIGFALFIGLGQMGIAENIITLAFGLTLGSVAVAAAIAFGLGGRDAASQLLTSATQKVKEQGSTNQPSGPGSVV